MAEINDQGNVQARCPGCHGALSSFKHRYWGDAKLDYRLFRCAGCGRGGIGVIAYGGGRDFPGSYRELYDFYPEVRNRLCAGRLRGSCRARVVRTRVCVASRFAIGSRQPDGVAPMTMLPNPSFERTSRNKPRAAAQFRRYASSTRLSQAVALEKTP